MRTLTLVWLAITAIAICVAIYLATGGHLVLLALPLLFGLPLLRRR
ncbi:hypothetical protein [Brevundimonas sp. Root1279]|nr:hypothetical protein [Brevundimonas sp. Root1279]